MSDTLLEVKNLSCGYAGRPVLNGIDLSIKEREVVLIAGPNGCGKSTLLKAIIGVLPLTSGEVSFNGESLTGKSVEERVGQGIGYLRQSNNIFPNLTVEENLKLAGMALEQKKDPKRGNESNPYDKILEDFKWLRSRLGQRAGVLSGGLRQALALAMVFMRQAALYLLDEPTAGLSPMAAAEIMDIVLAFMMDDVKRSFLIVEHRLNLIPFLNRTVFLSQGMIKSDTTDSRLFRDSNWLAKNYFG